MHHSRVMAGAMTLLLLSAPASWGAAPQKAKAVPAAEPFEGVVIAEGLAAPWDMVWGPDNHIWVSEREGSRIISVDPKTGEKKLVGSIPDVKVGPQHEGVLGIALDPDLGKNGSKNNVYIAHTYMDGGREHARIVRFHYDPQTRKIAEPKVILSNMPAGVTTTAVACVSGPTASSTTPSGSRGTIRAPTSASPSTPSVFPPRPNSTRAIIPPMRARYCASIPTAASRTTTRSSTASGATCTPTAIVTRRACVCG